MPVEVVGYVNFSSNFPTISPNSHLILREDPSDAERRHWVHELLSFGKDLLANVAVLSIEEIDWAKTRLFHKYKIPTSHYPGVVELRLSCCRFGSQKLFVRLLGTFPSLQRLNLHEIHCAASPELDGEDARTMYISRLTLSGLVSHDDTFRKICGSCNVAPKKAAHPLAVRSASTR